MTTEALTLRLAKRDDLPALVGLHAADGLGGHGDVWNAETQSLSELRHIPTTIFMSHCPAGRWLALLCCRGCPV